MCVHREDSVRKDVFKRLSWELFHHVETAEPLSDLQQRKESQRVHGQYHHTLQRHGEKCQSFRGKLSFITIERVSTKKIQKNKWRRPTHGFLHLNLKSLVRQAHERSCKLMSFRLGFFQGDQSGPLYDEKLPNSYSPVVYPSGFKHLSSDTVKSCSSSS